MIYRFRFWHYNNIFQLRIAPSAHKRNSAKQQKEKEENKKIKENPVALMTGKTYIFIVLLFTILSRGKLITN
jgi:hypothetical protein